MPIEFLTPSIHINTSHIGIDYKIMLHSKIYHNLRDVYELKILGTTVKLQ